MQPSLFYLLSLLYAFTTVLAKPLAPTAVATVPHTNAQRLAHGLPPLAPRRLFNPTRVSRRAALPSSAPTLTASFGVYKRSDNSQQGYISVGGGVSDTQVASTTFNFKNPSSADELLEFHGSTGLNSLLASYDNNLYLGPGNYNTVFMSTATLSTPAGSRQVADVTKGPVQYSESTVFRIDPATGIVTAQWVNPDGKVVPVYFAMWTRTQNGRTTKSLFFTGDIAAYKAHSPNITPLEEVTLAVVL
ncbi:hypothetical protein D9611_008980 [Ephemerocybe angulata]|uniref:Uncharacterized protein n=1 Tax=Ephemerocybe angulata TaxID=980116 RepID=A0A8H5BZ42_9AGAR|nr:hypothetical protein D9611_008980 [Tulosesus angulatus]